MAITTINPVTSSVIAPGDSFSFDIDDTYTAISIVVATAGGNEVAYDGTLGGAQAGYVVTVADDGAGTHTFTVKRSAGFSTNPTTVTVVEDETGTEATTAFTYYLTGTIVYPEGMNPYNSPYVGKLIVTEDDVARRGDVGWADFDAATFNVTDMGNGKVHIEGVASGTGDVVGPASAVEHSLPLYDGTTGKLLKAGVALGTATHVLTSNGPGAAPTMQAAPGAGSGTDFRGGATWLYDTSSLAGTGIASGDVRFNNAAIGSATEMYVAKTMSVGISSATLVPDWDGLRLLIMNQDADEVLTLTAGTVTDNSTYYTVVISAHSGTGTLTNNDTFAFTPNPVLVTNTDTTGDISLGLRAHGNITLGTTSSGTFDTDHVTPANVTNIRVNILNDMTGVFDSVATTGTLILRDQAAPTTNWYTFAVTNITDNPAFGKTFTGTMTGQAGSNFGALDYAIDYVANSTVHTGDVTGSVALTIAAKAVDVAMLADGTDGELITWDASGVAAVVATGTVGQVLTSGGAGVAPTMQNAAGGSEVIRLHYGGRLNLSVINTWYGSNPKGFNDALTDWSSAGGTGADPASSAMPWFSSYVAPAAITLTDIYTQFQTSLATLTGKIRIYKVLVSDDSAAYTMTQIGADVDLGGATTANKLYIDDQTGLSVSLAKGDKIMVFGMADTNPTQCYFNTQLTFTVD